MTDQLYIRSTIGESLMEALDSLIEANKITPELAHRVAQEVSAERRTGESLWPYIPLSNHCPCFAV